MMSEAPSSLLAVEPADCVPPRPLPLTLDGLADVLGRLLDVEAGLECLATGFQFLEGPAWNPARQELIFSDIPADRLYRWRAADGVSVFREPSHMANGNAFDAEGRLVTCEHAASRLTRTEADGSVTVLASGFDGRELNSPNDVVVHSDGSLWFTDPNFGRRPTRVGVARPQRQPRQAVYRWDSLSGTLDCLADDFEQPNGLCFGGGEGQLFVNDSPRGHIRVFAVEPNGRLSGGQVWATLRGDGPGVPDGMKVDERDNVWCAGPGGLHVFDAAGRPLGRIRFPEQAANFAWGGADGLSLFITASARLYRLRTHTRSR
jgi:gluconolactonase